MKIATLTLNNAHTIHDTDSISNFGRTFQKLPEKNEKDDTDMYDNEDNDISVTCHKIIEWGLNKIIIVGYSNGMLRVFDAPVKARDNVASTCTFSLQLCKNAITEIADVDLHEFKKKYSKNGAHDSNIEKDTLNIGEDGSFEWLFPYVCLNESSSQDIHNIEKESLDNYEDMPNSNMNEDESLQMAILISTTTTLTERVKGIK